jgi:hypothetical protein
VESRIWTLSRSKKGGRLFTPLGSPPPTTLPQGVKLRLIDDVDGVNVVLKDLQAVNPWEGLTQGPTSMDEAPMPSTIHF